MDAKIGSKSLAFMVRKVITDLIQSDQMAYVKDRYIGESVHLISDILEYTDNNGIEATLFSADFETSFDLIDHTFLFSVLKPYGFGPDFIQWVKTLFNNTESCVMNHWTRQAIFLSNEERGKETPCQRTLYTCLRSYVIV